MTNYGPNLNCIMNNLELFAKHVITNNYFIEVKLYSLRNVFTKHIFKLFFNELNRVGNVY